MADEVVGDGHADRTADHSGQNDGQDVAAAAELGMTASDRDSIEPSLVRRRTTKRRDPRSPVLNRHAPHTRLAGRRSPHLLTAPTSSLRSLSSDTDAARSSYGYTDQRSRRYRMKREEAQSTVGAHAGSLGSNSSKEWLIDSSSKLGKWAADVEQEQDYRREVHAPHADSSSAMH